MRRIWVNDMAGLGMMAKILLVLSKSRRLMNALSIGATPGVIYAGRRQEWTAEVPFETHVLPGRTASALGDHMMLWYDREGNGRLV